MCFCRLLCEFSPDAVETWLQSPIFPAEQCLEICKSTNNEGGMYTLIQRMGNSKEAINILLRIINRIECKRMLDQFSIINPKRDVTKDHRWATGKVYDYTDGLGRFDTYLEKAIQICEDKSNTQHGDEPWFMVLGFLQDYITDVYSKVHALYQKDKRL